MSWSFLFFSTFVCFCWFCLFVWLFYRYRKSGEPNRMWLLFGENWIHPKVGTLGYRLVHKYSSFQKPIFESAQELLLGPWNFSFQTEIIYSSDQVALRAHFECELYIDEREPVVHHAIRSLNLSEPESFQQLTKDILAASAAGVWVRSNADDFKRFPNRFRHQVFEQSVLPLRRLGLFLDELHLKEFQLVRLDLE